MYRKIPAILTALLLTASLLIVSTDSAEAKRGRNAAFAAGVALGVIGLGALSAQGHAREHGYVREHCERGPRKCRWVRGECYENRYGDVECEPGYRECRREVYCD